MAYIIRPYVTNLQTRKYFLPALWVKFLGAITLGLIYQFYYRGGDTLTYHTYGSKRIWASFLDDPLMAFKLIFLSTENTYNHLGIWVFGDAPSYFVVRVAAFFDLFTFGTYSATALFFAFFSFAGSWAMYSVFQRIYPLLNRQFAVAILFIPSVVFWGSGILKDTLTFGALGWVTFALINIFLIRRNAFLSFILLFLNAWILYSIKIYILLCLVGAFSIWFVFNYSAKINNPVLKILLAPFMGVVFLTVGYFSLQAISADDARYSLDRIVYTASVTANDIGYWTGKGAGSNYSLGKPDGSLTSMLSMAPQAVIVSLFRPFLWEVSNPLMLLAAIESLLVTILTLKLLFSKKTGWKWLTKEPMIVLCISFALVFAFAVGVSTYNFGSLMRYKIPLLPFYLSGLFILQSKR
ncbi:MAG: hypothetical protein RJQ09_08775 [Cyclobacteriaceae bacterium]